MSRTPRCDVETSLGPAAADSPRSRAIAVPALAALGTGLPSLQGDASRNAFRVNGVVALAHAGRAARSHLGVRDVLHQREMQMWAGTSPGVPDRPQKGTRSHPVSPNDGERSHMGVDRIGA